MADENPNETEELEGYDDSQRAEILEAEGRNHRKRGLVDDLTPDTGQPITESVAVEDELTEVGETPDIRDTRVDYDSANDGDADKTEDQR